MALTATAREKDTADEFRPVDRVNLVGILKEFRSDQAELVHFLSEHLLTTKINPAAGAGFRGGG